MWAPENTLTAFKRALNDGADGFECDVALTRDGEPVVIHKTFFSDDISKLIDKRGRLKDMDWKKLRRERTSGERIPHLYDALEFLCSNSMECFIEPKVISQELVTKIIKAIDKCGVIDKVHLITFFNRRQLLCLSKKLNPKIKTSVILIWPFGSWENKAKTTCADMIVPGWKGFALWKRFNHLRLLDYLFVDMEAKIRNAHAHGIPIYSGIADDDKTINWLCEIGVDGIFTDNVPLVKRIVTRYEMQSPDFLGQTT